MRTHAFLLINPRSGDDRPTSDEVADAARALGAEPHLLRTGEDPGAPARASGAAVLGIAGGDGSLSAVAAATQHRHTLHASINGDPVCARGPRPTGCRRRGSVAPVPVFRIDTRGDRVQAAIDGEPVVLETPVEVEIVPRALRLLLADDAEK